MRVAFNRCGFTLIEISVVLVIIGLLAGSILVGRDLIHEAELRAQIVQLQEFELASQAFKLKYDCIAGDCANGSDLFPAITENGNGNGLIENNIFHCYDLEPALYGYAQWSNSPEYRNFFVALSESGMIKYGLDATRQIGKGLPALKLNNNATFFAGDTSSFECNFNTRQPLLDEHKVGNNALWMVACDYMVTTNDDLRAWDDNGCGIFRGADLYAIDNKMDDGKPLSGRFYGFSPIWTDPAWGASLCLTGSTGSETYDVQATVRTCQATYVIN